MEQRIPKQMKGSGGLMFKHKVFNTFGSQRKHHQNCILFCKYVFIIKGIKLIFLFAFLSEERVEQEKQIQNLKNLFNIFDFDFACFIGKLIDVICFAKQCDLI